MTRRTVCTRGFLFLLLFATLTTAPAQAQVKDGNAGPPGGLAVNVVNPQPIPVTGNVTATITGPVATTITGPITATITPKLYFGLSAPTCDLANRCFVKFPKVPDNKILRVSHVHGSMFNTNVGAFVALDADTFAVNIWVRQLTPFGGAYLGPTLSFNEATDVVFEAGQTPMIELGTTGTFDKNTFNRLGITGELLDVQP